MPSTARNSSPGSRTVIIAATVVLGVAAIAAIFAPVEIADALGMAEPARVALLIQLYGAALFGLAMTGWMIRDSVVGGIFGRSYVVGNVGHALVGALILIRPALAPGATVTLVAITAVYWLLAITFLYLMLMGTPRA